MTFEVAALLLVALFPFVAWPLIQGRIDRVRRRTAVEDRGAELREEIELDLASGRLTADEALRRRGEV